MRDRLNILMVADVSPTVIRGGAERVLWEQASRLHARGHRVRILCRAASGEPAGERVRAGVPIRCFPVAAGPSLRHLLQSILSARRAVTQAVAEEPPDLLHLQQPLSALGALHAPAARNLGSLYTFHSPAPLEYASRVGMSPHHRRGLPGRIAQAILWKIERAGIRRVGHIHVLSDFSARHLWNLYRVPADRITKIPGGADTTRFAPAQDRPAVRTALGLPADRPLLLTVRNLEARMGLDLLLRAAALLRESCPEFLLLIGGSGSQRAPLESLVAELDLGRHVRFLGFVPDETLPHYYQAADLFVLPTRELEGFGLITVEALACGTPVLGTPVGATPEILRQLDPGLLFQDLTPQAMAADLARLLEAQRREPEAAGRLRIRCRELADREYGWEAVVGQLERLLAAIARGRAAIALPRQACPICGGAEPVPDLAYGGAPYLRCPRCRACIAAHLPVANALRERYEGDYPTRFAPERVTDSRAGLFEGILDRLGNGKGGRLLDVGCGGGHLARQARGRGWAGMGSDLSPQACLAARALGVPAVQGESSRLPIQTGCLEAVTLVNVLDHTLDPLAVLVETRRVLRPGGQSVIRVPNAPFHRFWIRLISALGPGVRSRGWDRYPILHVYGLGPRALRHLARRAGLEGVELRNSPAASEDDAGCGRAFRGLRAALGLLAAAAARLSGGRWLLAPSLELFARRPRGEGDAS